MILVLPMVFEILGSFSFGISQGESMLGHQLKPDRIRNLLVAGPLFLVLVFILITVFTIDVRKFSWSKKVVAGCVIAVAFYFSFPFLLHRINIFPYTSPGGIRAPLHPDKALAHDLSNIRRIIEITFVLITTALIGKIFELLAQRELIKVENEKLRAENLQSQYNLLLNQMNPHFFFNSMNSLSALVREDKRESALRYISELSDTFRYVMQSSDREMVTLEEELGSLSAYSYMLMVRYEGKLFFRIDVEESLLKMKLPVLSLQPLIENIIKHNAITVSDPVTVNVTGRSEGYLVVTNRIVPRQDKPDPMGIGLKNLATRYKLLSGQDIKVEDNGRVFTVTLPLKQEDKDENTDN